MSHPDNPLRRLIVAADVHRYSGRDSLSQVDTQEALLDVLSAAAAASRLDRARWERQAQGDSELAILPPDADEAQVVAGFVPALDKCLRRHNRSLRREARLRLRVAIHTGILHRGVNGYPGPAPIAVCRLLDAPPLKDALAAADNADLALIVSDEIFRDIVMEGYEGLRPEEFRKVTVNVKEFDGTGYIWLPGQRSIAHAEPQAKDESPPASPASASAPTSSPATVNNLRAYRGDAFLGSKYQNNYGGAADGR